MTEVVQKLLEEERARIRKANPYPYTTDYPVVPKFITLFLFLISRCLLKDMVTLQVITCADSTETRTKALHKTGTFPIGEPG